MLKFVIEQHNDEVRVYKVTETGKRILANRFGTREEALRDYPHAQVAVREERAHGNRLDIKGS